MRIALAVDHAGEPMAELTRETIRDEGHEPLDLGVEDDYPDAARHAADAVREGRAERAIVVCGSGAGIAVAANKIPGIRAATAHDTYTAHQGVEHDDVNVLCLGARVIGPRYAEEIMRAFLRASFSGEERHVRRLGKIVAIENEFSS